MRRRRRKGVSRRKVGLGTALVVTTLLLLAVSGTAVTAGLTGTPEVAVGATATDFPDYVAGLPAYAGLT
ncbi:MAG: hypothetical protein JWN08_188 [Frankiales bacterium]|nr:hypothetical protein [Frankiales bacterium]